MLKGYFDTIPKELEEAAIIEGAGPGKIFWSIVLPLAQPAIAITALFSFMTAWNEFILAATFMDQEEMYTAPVALRFFVGGFQQQWGYFAAGSIIVSIPVVLLFLYLQKYLVSAASPRAASRASREAVRGSGASSLVQSSPAPRLRRGSRSRPESEGASRRRGVSRIRSNDARRD